MGRMGMLQEGKVVGAWSHKEECKGGRAIMMSIKRRKWQRSRSANWD